MGKGLRSVARTKAALDHEWLYGSPWNIMVQYKKKGKDTEKWVLGKGEKIEHDLAVAASEQE